MEYPIWGVIALIFSMVSLAINVRLATMLLEHSEKIKNIQDYISGKTRFWFSENEEN